MSSVSDFTDGISNDDKSKMLDALVAKMIEDGNSDRIISDTVKCLLNYEPFIPEKGKSYDGLGIYAYYGVRGY